MQFIMKHILFVIVFIAQLFIVQGQLRKKLNTHLFLQYTGTIKDPNMGNNPWSMGIGLNHTMNSRSLIKPVIVMSAHLFLASDKVFRMFPDGSEISSIYTIVDFLGGPLICASKNFQLQIPGGISFVNGIARWAIEPGINLLSNQQKWRLQFSSKTIFNRIKGLKENYRGVAFSIGLRL